MQHGHDVPLALVSVSHATDGIIKGTTPFLMLNWLKKATQWLSVMCYHWHWNKQYVMLMALSIAPLHVIAQDDWNEMQHDFSGYIMLFALMLASHDDISIVKGTMKFLASRQSKWGKTGLFWSGNTLAIAISITWCHWCWCHMMSLVSVSVSHNAYSIINSTITLFRSRW